MKSLLLGKKTKELQVTSTVVISVRFHSFIVQYTIIDDRGSCFTFFFFFSLVSFCWLTPVVVLPAPTVHRFNVGVLPGTKLEGGSATLHICNNLLALARDNPPVIVGHWNLPDLRRYGPVPTGFVFEGGTRCGYCESIHLSAPCFSVSHFFLNCLGSVFWLWPFPFSAVKNTICCGQMAPRETFHFKGWKCITENRRAVQDVPEPWTEQINRTS